MSYSISHHFGQENYRCPTRAKWNERRWLCIDLPRREPVQRARTLGVSLPVTDVEIIYRDFSAVFPLPWKTQQQTSKIFSLFHSKKALCFMAHLPFPKGYVVWAEKRSYGNALPSTSGFIWEQAVYSASQMLSGDGEKTGITPLGRRELVTPGIITPWNPLHFRFYKLWDIRKFYCLSHFES